MRPAGRQRIATIGDRLSAFVSSTRNESARLFKSDLAEWLSHVHPAAPHVIYLPIISVLLLKAPTPLTTTLWLALGGLGFWTIAEYLLHRFAFHAPDHVMQETHQIVAALPPGAPAVRALPGVRHVIYFLMHGIHHEYPSDSTRLVMAPTVSLPIAGAFYIAFGLALGWHRAPAFFSGFIVGYLAYDTIHFLLHHRAIPTAVGRQAKQRHFRHHFVDPDRDYGVSSPLWDFVFGTRTANGK